MPTPAGIMMAKRVFMVFSNRSGAAMPIGTAFGVNCPGTVVTAAHVALRTGRPIIRLSFDEAM